MDRLKKDSVSQTEQNGKVYRGLYWMLEVEPATFFFLGQTLEKIQVSGIEDFIGDDGGI